MRLPFLKGIGALTRQRKAGKAATAIERLFDGVKLHQFSNYESYLQGISKKVWAAWKASDICANAMCNTPFVVKRGDSRDPVVIRDLQRLLTQPNQFQTFRELQYLAVMHLKATGNAYWYKSEATLSGDRPKELMPLNPKRIRIVTSAYSGEVVGYKYTGANGIEIPFDVEEIIHFKRPHPNNDYYGIGDIEPGESIYNEQINRNTWTEGFWKQGASPSGILFCKTQVESDETWEEIKARFRKQYGGAENAGKTALMTGDWSYSQLGLTAQEMQNIETSKWNVEQIFIMMGVPLSVAGIRDAANYATADIDNQRFKEYTILPLVLMLQDTLNTDLIAGWGDNLSLSFNVVGLINVGKVIQELAPAFDRGWISINEARERMGLNRDDENELWNQHFMNAGLVPVDLAGISASGGVTDQAAQRTVQRFIDSQFNHDSKTVSDGK